MILFTALIGCAGWIVVVLAAIALEVMSRQYNARMARVQTDSDEVFEVIEGPEVELAPTIDPTERRTAVQGIANLFGCGVKDAAVSVDEVMDGPNAPDDAEGIVKAVIALAGRR